MKKDHDNNQTDKQNKTTNLMTNSFFLKVKKTSLYKFFQRKDVKKYVIVVTSAIVIGLAFGLTTLKVLNHVGQPKGVDVISTVKSDEKSSQSIDIPSLHSYVIQGGVFSNEDNMTQLQSRFHEAGFKSVQWKKEDLYYLLLGVGASEADLNELKDSLLTHDLDAFVKPWETKKYQLSVEQGDAEWLDAFLTLWNMSITNEKEYDELHDEWHGFTERDTETSEIINEFKEKIVNIIAEQQFNDQVEKQFVLLKIWYYFEKLLLN